MSSPRLIVYSSLFPSQSAPSAGTFIRERMFRVARHLPIVVVAPQAWSPFDWAIRLFRPSFRPMAAARETMDGIEVHRPRWLSLPGVGKRFDGWLMARSTERCVREIHRTFGATAIDAHFLYPDGWAATRIAATLGLPCTITIRGSKDEWLIGTDREPKLVEAMNAATRLFAVSQALERNVAHELGIAPGKTTVIGNGVDLKRFTPVDKAEARRRLGIGEDATVIIGVGNLVPLKGFQRVIPLLPALREKHPKLLYLIVGGGATQGDMRPELELLARRHGVDDAVRFCGRQPQEELKWFYGASDLFAQATEFEGWCNVFLEAMACGLPVVTTRVGGNAEVVADPAVGELVDWWDADEFAAAILRGLERNWDRQAIVSYAQSNAWDQRVASLVAAFESLDLNGQSISDNGPNRSQPS
ncbi:MAG TPA: glycosyltransferase, partial [Burkholderiaceae bacterium]|nr:glycosyltransferase [Burkholderiaceae bacterium]